MHKFRIPLKEEAQRYNHFKFQLKLEISCSEVVPKAKLYLDTHKSKAHQFSYQQTNFIQSLLTFRRFSS